jgi:TPR repeat protein
MTLEVKDCSSPWADLYIHLNGDVKPCCYSFGTLGSLVRGDTLMGIARGELRRELQDFTRENRIHPLCAFASCGYVAGRPADASEQARYEDADIDCYGIEVDPGVLQAARFGQPKGIYLMAVALWMGGNYLMAIKWYQRGVELREVMSMHAMGDIYYHGYTLDAPDRARAYAYYQMAADLGYSRSMMVLGELKVLGEMGVSDIEGGVGLLRAAAKQGEKEAWGKLASLIEDGLVPSANAARDIERFRTLAGEPVTA